MNPTAFQIGSFEVRWYGILIAFGVIVAILLAGYIIKNIYLKEDCCVILVRIRTVYQS